MRTKENKRKRKRYGKPKKSKYQKEIDWNKKHKAKGRSEDSGRPSYEDLKTLTFSKNLSHI